MGIRRDKLAVHAIEHPALDRQVVQLRPTTRQYALSALGKAMCAAPVFIALPVVPAQNRSLLITMGLLCALGAFLIDLAANRDVRVDVSRAGLGTRLGLFPWWVIDEIEIRNHATERLVRICAFETLEIDLNVPRSGVFSRNPDFDAEAQLIMERWLAYRDDRPLDPLGLRSRVRTERRDLLLDEPVRAEPPGDDVHETEPERPVAEPVPAAPEPAAPVLIDLATDRPVPVPDDAPRSELVARALDRGRDRAPSSTSGSKHPLV